MMGGSTLQEFGLYNWRGGGGSMWFAPVASARPSECDKQMSIATQILNKYGFDYVSEFIVGWRDMHHIIDLLYDRTQPEEMKRAYSCFDELLTVFTNEAGEPTAPTSPSWTRWPIPTDPKCGRSITP